MGDGAGHGIGSHGEPADPLGCQASIIEGPEGFQPDEELPLGTEGGASGIDVIGGTGATGEDKIPSFQRALHEQGQELLTVIHIQEISCRRSAVKSRRPAGRATGVVQTALLCVLTLLVGVGCDDEITPIGDTRFGQVGELRVDVQRPLSGGIGSIETALVWQSTGRWVLVERIRYQGVQGAERVLSSRLNPGDLAPEFASLNRQLNETAGLRIVDEVPTDLDPQCSPPRSRVSVTMVDSRRGELKRWDRCANGDLFELVPTGAGPDAAATRVVTAAQLARSFTLGDRERSVFQGSIPFAEIDSGETTPATPDTSRVFLSDSGGPPADFVDFWASHAGGAAELPEVDWDVEMVLLATTGIRNEAGHRIRVRRVLPVGMATRVEVLEEIPGDFCAPATVLTYPYHLVKAPRGPEPVTVSVPLESRVPCGL